MEEPEVDDEPQRSWWGQRPLWLRIVVISGAVVAFVLIWLLIPPLLYGGVVDEVTRLKAITDTRTALLAGLVGVGALGTFWMNSLNVKLTAKSIRVSEENLRLAKRSQELSFELAERGHLTDRYSKAIEQLGNDNLDVRLGGIYALEQLATDSPEGRRNRDQSTIIEVLSAFVRVHSDPLYQYRASLGENAPPESADQQHEKVEKYVAELDRPPVDVQAAVTVLGRLPTRSESEIITVDLAGAWLRKIDFSSANLANAMLNGTNLSEAHLSSAILARASLGWANLAGAKLWRADLSVALLPRANLTNAELTSANLTTAWIDEADLTGANLRFAKLAETSLVGANLTGANLAEAKGLTQEQLDGTIGDGRTQLPPGLQPPDSWFSERTEASVDEADGAASRGPTRQGSSPSGT